MTSIRKAHELWTAVASMFSSLSRSRINNIRIALSNVQKGTQTVGAYFAHIRSLADELAAAGKPLDDDEVISYILAGLDMEYQPLVSALDTRKEPITIDDLFAQVSNFHQCIAMFHGAGNNAGFKSSANAAVRGGRGGSRGYRGPPCNKGKSKSSGGNDNSQQQRLSWAALLHQQQGPSQQLQEPPRRCQVSNLRQDRSLSKGLLVPV